MSPRCTAFLTADRAWREDNGKIGLAGIFESMTVEKTPAQIQGFFIYFTLRNIPIGKHKVVVKLADTSKNIILNIDGELESKKDDTIFQAHMVVPPLLITDFGTYYFYLYFDDIDLVKHQIVIEKK